MRQLLTIFIIVTISLLSNSQTKAQNFSQSVAHGLVKMDKSYFFYKDLKTNQVKEENISVKNFSKEDIEIYLKGVPNYISFEVSPQIIKPNELGQIKFIYNTPKRIHKDGSPILGKEYRRIPIYIKGKEKSRDARRDYVTIRTFIQEDFSHLTKKQLKRAPIIKFDTIVYNFGEVKQGTVVIHDFKFKNLGKEDLDIRYAKGC